MEVLLDAEQMDRILHDLADEIATQTPPEHDLAIIGIRSRGEILAQRLADYLSQELGKPVPCGTLDITLYRDDLNAPHGGGQPQVRTTEIGFDIDGKIIILVDDVLYTGRSARAAMDALIDLGRPKAIRLAVLVEQGRKRAAHPSRLRWLCGRCRARSSPSRSTWSNRMEKTRS